LLLQLDGLTSTSLSAVPPHHHHQSTLSAIYPAATSASQAGYSPFDGYSSDHGGGPLSPPSAPTDYHLIYKDSASSWAKFQAL